MDISPTKPVSLSRRGSSGFEHPWKTLSTTKVTRMDSIPEEPAELHVEPAPLLSDLKIERKEKDDIEVIAEYVTMIRGAIDAQTNGHREQRAEQQHTTEKTEFLTKTQDKQKQSRTSFFSGVIVKGKDQVSNITVKGKRLSAPLFGKPRPNEPESKEPQSDRTRKRVSLAFLSDTGKKQASNIKSQGKRISGFFASTAPKDDLEKLTQTPVLQDPGPSRLICHARTAGSFDSSEDDEGEDEEAMALLSPGSTSSSFSEFDKPATRHGYVYQLEESRLKRGSRLAKEAVSRGRASMSYRRVKDLLSLRRKPGGWTRLDT